MSALIRGWCYKAGANRSHLFVTGSTVALMPIVSAIAANHVSPKACGNTVVSGSWGHGLAGCRAGLST